MIVLSKSTALSAVLLIPLAIPSVSNSSTPPYQATCAMDPADRKLLQQAADGWRRTEDRVIGSTLRKLPWMILFDTTCVYHVAPPTPPPNGTRVPAGVTFRGSGVEIWGWEHRGFVHRPNGDSLPVGPMAFTTPTGDGETPLVVFALPDVWARHPAFASDEARAGILSFWIGVLAHELVHTRQLAPVARRIEELEERFDLPEDYDDDIVQDRFGEIPEFRQSITEELDLLHRAAGEHDETTKRALTRQVLAKATARRQRYFRDDNAVYAELDELFLALEGAASWAAFLEINDEQIADEGVESALAEYDPNKGPWVQAYGLLVYALVDRFAPDWAASSFDPDRPPPSPFELLEDALTNAESRRQPE